MQGEEIGRLLKQDRGQFFDYLSAFEFRKHTSQKKHSEDLAREIARILSGMANADGGTLLVGIELDKTITGVPHDPEEIHKLVQAPQALLMPPLNAACEKSIWAICFCSSSRSPQLSKRTG